MSQQLAPNKLCSINVGRFAVALLERAVPPARVDVDRANLDAVLACIQCDARGFSIVSIASGLAAFKIDRRGTVTQTFDGPGDRAYVASLSRGELATNRRNVKLITKRVGSV